MFPSAGGAAQEVDAAADEGVDEALDDTDDIRRFAETFRKVAA
jgi:hypothetical protein